MNGKNLHSGNKRYPSVGNPALKRRLETVSPDTTAEFERHVKRNTSIPGLPKISSN